MRTTHRRSPSTSKRLADPASTSLTEHTRSSPMAVLHLLDHAAPERTDQRRDGQAVENIVEEPEHDQSLRLRRRHTTALAGIELALVHPAHAPPPPTPHVLG